MNLTANTRRNCCNARAVLAALATLPAVGLFNSAHAADSTWNVNAAGNFTLGSNWTAGVPGSDTGTTSTDVATFNRTLITGNRTITLDANRNLAGITFSNNAATGSNIYQIGGATFGAVSAGTLTLSPNAVIQNIGTGAATGGSNGIDVNMVLTGNTSVTNTHANTVFHLGINSGAGNNTITTGTNLGNIDLTLGGTSTGSNLMSMRLNQATGTTLRLVKDGTGFWQINGLDPTGTLPAPRTQGLTGGLLIRQGGVSIGRNSANSIGTGTITLGDSNTTAGDLYLQTGSGVTITNNITVANSTATNVIIERLGTGGDSIYQGTITLGRDLVLRQRTAGTARNLNIASNSILTGTGNVIINTTLASATGVVTLGGGSGAGTGSINMTGKIINQSTTGTAGVNITGKVLGNVNEVVQNSATSPMTISNTANLFNKTTVSAGILSTGATGRLGTGDITIANGATLTLGNTESIQNSSAMFFGSTSLINLNFSGADTLSMLALRAVTDTYITPGTYTVAQLNSFFGGSVFTGTGSFSVLTMIPEPSSFAAFAGIGVLGLAVSRRRTRR